MSKLVYCRTEPANPATLTEAETAELVALQALPDEDIDYSDIPRTPESFWVNAQPNPHRHGLQPPLIEHRDADEVARIEI